MIREVGAVCTLAVGSLLFQTLPPQEAFTLLTQAERLTLVGALVAAVLVLWRALNKKDDLIGKKDVDSIENAKLVVQALTTASNAQQQLAIANKELQEAINRLRESLHELPCTRADELRVR